MSECAHGVDVLDPCPVCDKVREMEEERIVIIDYTNHRGERRERRVIPSPRGFEFTETPDHKPAQWVIRCWDLKKGAQRTFALKDIHSWRPAP